MVEITDDALQAAMEAYDDAYEAELVTGALDWTDNRAVAMRAALVAANAAAWSSDMDAAPKDGQLLVWGAHVGMQLVEWDGGDPGHPTGPWPWVATEGASYSKDTFTHRRLPPALPEGK